MPSASWLLLLLGRSSTSTLSSPGAGYGFANGNGKRRVVSCIAMLICIGLDCQIPTWIEKCYLLQSVMNGGQQPDTGWSR